MRPASSAAGAAWLRCLTLALLRHSAAIRAAGRNATRSAQLNSTGHTQHGRGTDLRTPTRLAASNAVDGCHPVVIGALLLERHPVRVKLFEENSRRVEMVRLPALDGGNHSAFLEFWRQAGFRLNPRPPVRGWMRSYGAVSATLGHLKALRWQVRHQVPFMLRLEDDMRIRDGPKLLRQLCNYTRLFHPDDDDDGPRGGLAADEPAAETEAARGLRVVHLNYGRGTSNVGAEAYLTSRESAARELRRICERGINNGFDYMTNKQNTTFHIGRAEASLYLAQTNAASGKGSYVMQLTHFNATPLIAESADWPLKRCLRWAGVDEPELAASYAANPSWESRRGGNASPLTHLERVRYHAGRRTRR